MKAVKIFGLLAGLLFIGTAQAHYDGEYGSGNRWGHRHAWDYRGHRGEARLNAQQYRQNVRIEDGLARGVLTPREYELLARQQNRIARTEAYFRSDDGRLDRHERRILRNKLANASQTIYNLKHNDRNNLYPYYYH